MVLESAYVADRRLQEASTVAHPFREGMNRAMYDRPTQSLNPSRLQLVELYPSNNLLLQVKASVSNGDYPEQTLMHRLLYCNQTASN